MPEIMDLVSYNDFLFYEGSSVRIVEDYQIIEYGKLSMTHGNVLGGGGVHVAHNRLKKAMMSIMTAHSRQAE